MCPMDALWVKGLARIVSYVNGFGYTELSVLSLQFQFKLSPFFTPYTTLF